MLGGHTGGGTSVAFSPVGARIASASDDLTLGIWDATPMDAEPINTKLPRVLTDN